MIVIATVDCGRVERGFICTVVCPCKAADEAAEKKDTAEEKLCVESESWHIDLRDTVGFERD
jgi:hypothetical protein